MGTRSLTYVYSGDSAVVCMYRQYDGYPSGHGSELAEFLNSFDAITNGIEMGERRKTANGMGCLAAQMVANFKGDVGEFYLYPADATKVSQVIAAAIQAGWILLSRIIYYPKLWKAKPDRSINWQRA